MHLVKKWTVHLGIGVLIKGTDQEVRKSKFCLSSAAYRLSSSKELTLLLWALVSSSVKWVSQHHHVYLTKNCEVQCGQKDTLKMVCHKNRNYTFKNIYSLCPNRENEAHKANALFLCKDIYILFTIGSCLQQEHFHTRGRILINCLQK